MADIGSKTKSKHCRKCGWCSQYDDWDVIANTHTPVHYCTFKRGINGNAPTKPTLNEDCPYFGERYQNDDEEEE